MNIVDQYKKNTPSDLVQEKAWSKFVASGFPNKKVEAFKYNKLSQNEYEQFNYLDKISDAKTVISQNKMHPIHVQLYNGYLKPLTIINDENYTVQPSLTEQTVVLKNSNQTTDNWNSLHHLNHAFSKHGYSIDVPQNKTSDSPLVIQHRVDKNAEGYAINNNNQITLNAGSSITLVEFFSSEQNSLSYFQNQTLSIHCKENAHLTLIRVQDDANNAIHQSSIDVFQEKNSSTKIIHFSLGAYRSRLDASIQLLQDNAQSNLSGLYIAKDKQFHDHYTNIYHGHANTFSQELFKGILNDHAEAAFAGKIYVEKNAQKIESKQMNRNLMLSDDASAYSVPQLEIFADDVKCAHGSTVGELNPDELFYLRSRGFSEHEAKLALVKAYANEITELCEVNFVKDYINDSFLKKLF
ncbi:MAG TPA: Fe-S cluster assembly protein SufD [Oligoflexia bacterium]|nr:Fe-S cluster assembly protein SufD [Oligoflexia bacterium]HMR23827.1 Fe-S cluster assembly protein SufD [Oligoflexia bacterium]